MSRIRGGPDQRRNAGALDPHVGRQQSRDLLTTHNLERAVGWATVTLLADGKICQTAAAATLTTATVRAWLAATGSLS